MSFFALRVYVWVSKPLTPFEGPFADFEGGAHQIFHDALKLVTLNPKPYTLNPKP